MNKVNTIETIAQEIHCYKTAEFFIALLILSWVFFIPDSITLERPDLLCHVIMVVADVLAPNTHHVAMLTQLWQQCYRNHNTQYTYHITGIKQAMFRDGGMSANHWFLWVFNGYFSQDHNTSCTNNDASSIRCLRIHWKKFDGMLI